jgi:hypothetical protein
MRRKDLIKAVAAVNKAIEKSQVFSAIGPLNKKPDPLTLLTSYQAFASYYKEFGETEREVFKILGLEGLEDAKTWATLFESREDDRMKFNRYRASLRFTADNLPKILNLLKQDHIEFSIEGSNRPVSTDANAGLAVLSVIMPESENEVSKPQRLINVLESINLFYSVSAVLQEMDANDLSVAAIDSGSDKSIDFLGAATLIESVKNLILEMWDRIVYYKTRQAESRLDLIIKALPVMEKINNMVAAGTISPEQGELLRRDVSVATSGFISAGAIIPELDVHAIHSPRKIMAPEPKLLNTQGSLNNSIEDSSDTTLHSLEDDIDETDET